MNLSAASPQVPQPITTEIRGFRIETDERRNPPTSRIHLLLYAPRNVVLQLSASPEEWQAIHTRLRRLTKKLTNHPKHDPQP